MPEGRLIAVVDDDRSVRNATQDLLNAAGFTTLTFDSARSFLGSSARAGIACLVADMRMPGMTGLELYEQLAESGPAIPTVIITAHPEEMAREQVRAAGIHFVLTKPFSPDELLECVRKALADFRGSPVIPKS
jgi:FixJ family two-component response regulator